ncbi:MAG: hypothetical protein ACI38Q_03675, partial [Candidatus Bruticola sp.]
AAEEEEARIRAEAEAKAKAAAEEEEARIRAEAEEEFEEDDNVISAGGRTFNFVPFDSATYVPKRAPRLPEVKSKRNKNKSSASAAKYSYKDACSDEPKVGTGSYNIPLPPPVFKGNTTNIDTSYSDIASTAPIPAAESTEAPYVPPVSVQQAAREQYFASAEAAVERRAHDESVYPEPTETYREPASAQLGKQRIPMLKSAVPGLPQQPSLTLRAGILHSSNHSRHSAETQDSVASQASKKGKRKH